MMDGRQKSDSCIVPWKPANKAPNGAAEPVEGRRGPRAEVSAKHVADPVPRITLFQASALYARRSGGGPATRPPACALSTLGRSRMREFRSYGSVRGARGNPCPYRAPPFHAVFGLKIIYCSRSSDMKVCGTAVSLTPLIWGMRSWSG
jgi:hypothetical protein